MPSRRIFLAFFLTTAFVSLALGIWQVADRQRFLREAEKTVGQVVKLEKSGWTRARYGPSQPLYRAVVRYRTATGAEVEFRDTTSSRPALYAVGDTVDVWYRPKNPRDAIVHRSWWSVWFAAVIGLGLGVLFIACAFIGNVMLRHAAERDARNAKTDRRYN